MANEHQDAWVENIRAKSEEVRAAAFALVTKEAATGGNTGRLREALYAEASKQINALSDMFSKTTMPSQITRLRQNLQQFRQQRSAPQNLTNLLKSMDDIEELYESNSSYISFHDIFESYRDDDELNALIDQLIGSLEKIIEEGEDHLNSRLEKDLRRLLEQIKGAKSASLYELAAWAEVTSRIMAEIAGQKIGLPGASLFVDAAKMAWKVKQNLGLKYQSGESDLVRILEVKTVGINIDELANVTSELLGLEDTETGSSSGAHNPLEDGECEG